MINFQHLEKESHILNKEGGSPLISGFRSVTPEMVETEQTIS